MSAEAKSLVINEKFPVAVGDLFNAWVDAAVVKAWMAPGAMKVGTVQIDPKVSGEYLVEMKDPAGESVLMQGQILELKANQKLVLRWRWLHSDKPTEVTVEFVATGGGESELHLIHGVFESMDDTQNHQTGWQGCLEKLGKVLA